MCEKLCAKRLKATAGTSADMLSHLVEQLLQPIGRSVSAWMRMSNSANSIWRSVCRPLWKFLAASMLVEQGARQRLAGVDMGASGA